tara:strand:+ start:261 stop:467 length:207 start_codon:yes stop_codon:yes gene_type:complete
MKNKEILRMLLQERVNKALRVNDKKMINECLKIGLSKGTLYDFANYHRGYVLNSTANKLLLATKAILD